MRTPGALLARTQALRRLRSRGFPVGGPALARVALAAIVLVSLLVVVVAADRPSFLTPASRTGFFPAWIAGPLGGLWPQFTEDPNAYRYVFTFAIVGMYACYVVAIVHAPRLRARWAIGTVLAVHLIFLLSPPLSLTDIFNYINYGRMGVIHGLNPYVTTPMLEPHSDPAFDLSNWHSLLSPYGPLFTIFTFALVPLGVAASFWTLKVVLMVASLGTVALVWKCARLLGRDPLMPVVFVGLNPIVLVWGLGGDHNDFLMVFFIVLAIYLLLRAGAIPGAVSDGLGDSRSPAAPAFPSLAGVAGASATTLPSSDSEREPGHGLGSRLRGALWPLPWWELGAGVTLIVAVAIKASAAVLLPVVLIGLLARPRRLAGVLVGMLLAGLVLGVASYAAFGAHLPDLTTQSRLVTVMALPNLLGLALGLGGETVGLRVGVTAVLVLVVLAVGVRAWRRGELIAMTGWATIALIVTLSWVLPWYALWMLPLAALGGSRRQRRVVLIVGAYLIFAWVPVMADLFNLVGFNPNSTPLAKQHQLETKNLLH